MQSMANQISEARKSRSVLKHTLASLIASSKKARDKMNDVKKVEILQMKPVPQTNQLLVKAQALGISEKRIYPISIMFSQVSLQDMPDGKHPLTVDMGNGNKMYMEKIGLNKHKCQVRCGCKDYYFMWQWYNKGDRALFGKPFPKYVRKTDHYPERNPGHHPGLCKHLMVLVDKLAKMGLIVR